MIIDPIKGSVIDPYGVEVVTPDTYGYVRVYVYGLPGKQRSLKRAHVIWWKATGKWPEFPLDHINGTRDDDRFENLRPTDRYLNMRNQKRHRNG